MSSTDPTSYSEDRVVLDKFISPGNSRHIVSPTTSVGGVPGLNLTLDDLAHSAYDLPSAAVSRSEH